MLVPLPAIIPSGKYYKLLNMTSFLSFIHSLGTHLWLSLSSVKFYERVLTSYKGYGIKYILTLSFIPAMICSGIFLNYVNKVDSYFTNDEISQESLSIDRIIKQLPLMEYDGRSIKVLDNTPIFLNDNNGHKIIAIDPKIQLSPQDRVKIPIILGSDKIIINLFNSQGTQHSASPIKYSQIFGNQPQTITQEVIKSIFSEIIKKSYKVFIYAMFPFIGLMIFINMLLEKSIIILALCFIMRIMNLKISMKSCIRVALFATGISALFQFVIVLVLPDAKTVFNVIQLWANLLMILGISKTISKNKFLVM